MLNPQGYAVQAKAAGPDNDKIMQSARANITTNRATVIEFIEKETNVQRRMALREIFDAAEAIKTRFDGHKQCEIRQSAVYKEMAIKLFTLIRKQKHAGRKLFLCNMSNPILGFDVVTHFYYPTIRGIKSSQLEMMDDYINELKGTEIKIEPESKPFGLSNVPRSESSRKSAGKNCKIVKIRHADLKNDITASIASILVHHNVPVQWLDHNIDTSEMPNAFKRKANILINMSLVVEMTNESLGVITDNLPEDIEWNSTDGWFEREANAIINKSNNKTSNNNNRSISMDIDTFMSIPHNRSLTAAYQDDILIDLTKAKQDNAFSDISSASNESTDIPAVSNNKQIQLPISSTPTINRSQAELPRPNDSIASIGLPDEILELEMIRTQPLETPRPNKKPLVRSSTIQPQILRLDSIEDESVKNASLPATLTADQNNDIQSVSNMPDAIASTRDIATIEGLLKQMSSKFDQLEKSINKKD